MIPTLRTRFTCGAREFVNRWSEAGPDTSYGSCYRKTYRHDPEGCKDLQSFRLISLQDNFTIYFIHIFIFKKRERLWQMYSLSFLKSFFVHQRMLLRQLSMKLQRTPVLRNRCKHCFQIHRSQPVPVEKSQKICLLFLRKVMHHEHFVRKIAAKIKLRRRREASQSKRYPSG